VESFVAAAGSVFFVPELSATARITAPAAGEMGSIIGAKTGNADSESSAELLPDPLLHDAIMAKPATAIITKIFFINVC